MQKREIENDKRVREALAGGAVFSLSCVECDAGQGVDSYDAALAAGWQGIFYTPCGFGWNFLGDCPECLANTQ